MQFVIVLAILAVVVFVVSAPLRREYLATDDERALQPSDVAPAAGEEVGDLEAARDAKYREIRDAELDHRTGKLSDADYEAVDQALRSEAIAILNALDRAKDRAAATIGER
jgi:hypothetical protein